MTCFALLCLLAFATASAETITADGVGCTLADAILSANTGTTFGGCTGGSPEHDVIILDYDVVLSAADTVSSTSQRGVYAGLPEITSVMTIQAGLGSVIERDDSLGCDNVSTPFRLLHVFGGGDLLLQGLTLRNGCAASSSTPAAGGAVLVKDGGTLALDGCTFSANIAWSSPGKDARGGAVSVEGSTSTLHSVIDSVFSGNIVRSGASSFSAVGGAIAIREGTLGLVSTSEFRDNEAYGGSSDNDAGAHAQGGGVGVILGSVGTIDRTLFESNLVVGGDSTLARGGSAYGPAFYAKDSAVGEIRASSFSLNESLGGNGTESGRASGCVHLSGGTFNTLTATSFLTNRAASGDGTTISIVTWAGAVFLGVDVDEVTNNTFVENECVGGNHLGTGTGGSGTGGALRTSRTIANLAHNTFVSNRAFGGTGSEDGTGIGQDIYAGTELITVSNNIFWDDRPTDLDVPSFVAACRAVNFVSAGYNIISDPGSCNFNGPGDMIGVDPLLLYEMVTDGCTEPLLDGSCPPMRMIDTLSSAIDQGICTTSGVTEDGRSAARPYDEITAADADDGCDIGAYEYYGRSTPSPDCEDCDDGR
jgi:hypothetical protein